nr:SDR family oxidoreductase [uncultured Blautia sp.]
MGDLFDLTGKIAVVTGASSGLGADAALAYADAGANVVLLARRYDKLNKVKGIIEKRGKKALSIKCDITKEDMVCAAIHEALETFGHIDILLNNAGVALRGGVDDLTDEVWNTSFDTNVKGIYLLSKYIIPQMKDRHYGKIVNVSSVNAIVADKSDAFIRHSYNASKSAIIGLTKGMAATYAKFGITVNAIGPALFKTEMTEKSLFKSEEFLTSYSEKNPTNRPGRKCELNGTILYLSSDASSYVQGQFIVVDGGGSIV